MWPWSSSDGHAQPSKNESNSSPSIQQGKTEGIPSGRVNPPDSVKPLLSQLEVSLDRLEASLEPYPRLMIASVAFGLGGLVMTNLVAKHGYRLTRLRSGDWVTPLWLTGKRQWIKGVVTRVGDGDNFRLFHTPPLGGHRWRLRFREMSKVTDTLHIRLAGVDAPELSHFGKPAQPYAQEALDWLTGKILHRTVYCQLISRDRYKRVVANVYLPYRLIPAFIYRGRNVSLEMLKAGWATTYSQSGAEYGSDGVEKYKKVEEEAKRARRGMYAEGDLKETPAEYKRRHSQAPADPERDADTISPVTPPKPGLLSRLLGKK